MGQSPVMPKVSVIIPVYNAEQYLWECLDSLRAQTLKEMEILCVDDGSTDHSRLILEACAKLDPRIQIFRQENQGAAAARNKAISCAKGEYILFLDSDDFFDPNMARKAYEKAVSVSADICLFRVYRFHHDAKKIEKIPWTCDKSMLSIQEDVFSAQDIPNRIFQFTTPAPWNKLFRRNFLVEHTLLFQNIRTTNDLAFTYSSLALAKAITVIDDYLLYYRVSVPASLQATRAKEPLLFFDAILELKRRLVQHGVYERLKISFINAALECCVHNLKAIQDEDTYRESFLFLKNTGLKQVAFDELRTETVFQKDEYKNLQLNWEAYKAKKGLFQSPARSHAPTLSQMSALEKELAACKKELQLTRASFSFRLGRFLTFLPRKLRGGLRCYREHGLNYTLRRIKEKLSRIL